MEKKYVLTSAKYNLLMASFHYAIYLFAGKGFSVYADVDGTSQNDFTNNPLNNFIDPYSAMERVFGVKAARELDISLQKLYEKENHHKCRYSVIDIEYAFKEIRRMLAEGTIVVAD